ncbi:hypothetical protein CL628_01095 [bacterium]|nr:hypothetical protein [bacterium]|tara:strand:- start:42 stop:455 length:414 start_codon:yes stop_codon:yes gene_type:complete
MVRFGDAAIKMTKAPVEYESEDQVDVEKYSTAESLRNAIASRPGLTDTVLAGAIGVSRQTIIRWKKKGPHEKSWDKLWRFFEDGVEEFEGGIRIRSEVLKIFLERGLTYVTLRELVVLQQLYEREVNETTEEKIKDQ